MTSMLQVGISDMKISKKGEQIITYALGSCIGVCLYDSILKQGAMVHVMLPNCTRSPVDNAYKYADTGVAETIRQMTLIGSNVRNIKAKIAGGAKMFETNINSAFGNIGERNAEAVKISLRKYGITLLAQDIGLNYGRTMILDSKTGVVTIKSYSSKDVTL